MNSPRRVTNRVRRHREEESPSQVTSALVWAIGILVLVSAAVLSWVGSFYIFGHPEEPFSYKVMKTLKKIEPSKRFELTAAPRGEFLSPEALYKRYSEMTPLQLEQANNLLLRNYIRNYAQTKDPVPYVIGQYTILESFDLGADDFFPSGVIAVARANEEPRVLLEHVFTSLPANVTDLQRMLLTGLEINLQRRMDLSAVINVQKLSDGRILLTALPLIYGSYASTQGPGTFSLEPPASLNVAAGLPVVRSARLEAAAEKYAAFRRRAGLPQEDPNALPPGVASNQLLRVQRPEPVEEAPVPAPSQPEPSPSPVAVAVAEPVQALPALPVLPATTIESPDAIEDASAVAEVEEPTPRPSPTATPAVVATPTPSPTATPAPAIANVRGRNWEVYDAGKMPRGRLVSSADISRLAERGIEGERVYIEGNFEVTAASDARAVMRSRRNADRFRIIVDFPAGASAPAKGEQVNRDASRPFLITGITKGDDGIINVQVREITKP